VEAYADGYSLVSSKTDADKLPVVATKAEFRACIFPDETSASPFQQFYKLERDTPG